MSAPRREAGPSAVDQAIERAMAEGKFRGLPGEGKPLDLATPGSPLVPAEWPMAYKVMGDAGLAPAWADLARELAGDLAAIARFLSRQRERMRRARARLEHGPAADFRTNFRAATRRHFEARAGFAALLRATQAKIGRFSLIAPDAIARPALDADAQLAAFDACWPYAKPAPTDAADLDPNATPSSQFPPDGARRAATDRSGGKTQPHANRASPQTAKGESPKRYVRPRADATP